MNQGLGHHIMPVSIQEPPLEAGCVSKSGDMVQLVMQDGGKQGCGRWQV